MISTFVKHKGSVSSVISNENAPLDIGNGPNVVEMSYAPMLVFGSFALQRAPVLLPDTVTSKVKISSEGSEGVPESLHIIFSTREEISH